MKVELIGTLGDDLSIANAARVSYAKESAWETDDDGLRLTKQLKAADAGLINYLMKNRHGTPFEMVVFTFRVRVPIGVAREWMRHRIGSFNEVSTRYVEMEPDFYVPQGDAIRRQVGKPGHYTFEPFPWDAQDNVAAMFRQSYDLAYAAYQGLLASGVAKELARNVLPLGLMTQFIWAVNLRSLFNFLSLRTHPTALHEIREAAQEVERLARPIASGAFTAFDEHGRVAP